MPQDMKLEACPFCGADVNECFAGLTPLAFARGPDGTYAVDCLTPDRLGMCGAMGPSASTMEGAIAAWNTRALSPTRDDVLEEAAFQERVQPWMMECFGAEIAADVTERCDRFIEEAFELVQALGYNPSRAKALVDYTWGRPVGEPSQEVGGVMVTLAALCLARGLDMHEAGETELARINVPETITKIRAKQAAKAAIDMGSPIPDAQTIRSLKVSR